MNDIIYRKDAIQALVDTEEIKGFAYRMLEDRLIEIPPADRPRESGSISREMNGCVRTADTWYGQKVHGNIRSKEEKTTASTVEQ